jgi:hypothetical protein
VIFAIRTRRLPFFRSRPSIPLVLAAFGVVAVGATGDGRRHLRRRAAHLGEVPIA